MAGFGPAAHTAAKLQAANKTKVREYVDKKLGETIAELDEYLAAIPGPADKAQGASLFGTSSTLTLANQSRRIDLPTTWQLDVGTIVKLNQLLAAEGDVLNHAQRFALECVLDSNKPGNACTADQIVAAAQSLRDLMVSKTDEVLRRTYAVPNVGGSELTVRVFPAEEEALLEDWLRVCKKPNDAEMYMLGTYVNRDVWEIYDWFKHKRAETNSMYLYLANATAKGKTSVLRHAAVMRVQAAFNRLRRNIRYSLEVKRPKPKSTGASSSSRGQKRKATTPLETIVEEMD